jgi:hypothetical protein
MVEMRRAAGRSLCHQAALYTGRPNPVRNDHQEMSFGGHVPVTAQQLAFAERTTNCRFSSMKPDDRMWLTGLGR